MHGLAWVAVNKKFGCIDRRGKIIIPIKYDIVWPYTDGLVLVRLNGKTAFFDKNGKEKIPFIYFALPFNEGLAAVERNGKCGYINSAEKLLYHWNMKKPGFLMKEWGLLKKAINMASLIRIIK